MSGSGYIYLHNIIREYVGTITHPNDTALPCNMCGLQNGCYAVVPFGQVREQVKLFVCVWLDNWGGDTT
eukprot:7192562-Pyramimonas_sp.AAC.1